MKFFFVKWIFFPYGADARARVVSSCAQFACACKMLELPCAKPPSGRDQCATAIAAVADSFFELRGNLILISGDMREDIYIQVGRIASILGECVVVV